MKKLQIEEWTSDDGRKLIRRLSADVYQVDAFSCTRAELAELGAAIADALTPQSTVPLRETVFRCHECGEALCVARSMLTLPLDWRCEENGFVTCPACRAQNIATQWDLSCARIEERKNVVE